MFSTGFTSFSVLLFFLYWSPSLSLCMVFGSISSSVDKVLPINPSANVFLIGDFNVHYKDWFTLLRWLTQMISFLSRKTRISVCDSHSLALLDLFISSDAICSTMAFPPFGNSDRVVVSVSIDVPSNTGQNATFHHIAFDYFHANWDGLHDHLRDVPWNNIFKLGGPAAASEFYEWIQVGIDEYSPQQLP